MSDEEDKSQKTEQPTPHKIEQAKKDGQVTTSKEVNHWFMLTTFALLLVYVFPTTFKKLALLMQYYFDHASQLPVTSAAMGPLFAATISGIGKLFALPLLFLVVAAIASGLVQTKGVVSAKALEPKLSKVSFGEGLKRLFGSKAIVEFFKNIIKLTIMLVIAYMMMRPEFDRLHMLPQLDALGILQELAEVLLKLLIVVVSVITVIAGLDYAYQKYKFIEDLKMSKKEIKDEAKEMDGDPQIKAKLAQLRMEKANQRMMNDVPDSTVILTNPTHYAVALKYDMDKMDTPILVAKGTDAIAMKIREVGEDKDIPILENPPLTRALHANVAVGDEIPKAYFEAVARIIRYIYGYEQYYQNHLDEDIESVDIRVKPENLK